MNNESFNKIINNDKEDISSKDFTKAIEYFFTIKDNNSKKQFLNNFKSLINYYFRILFFIFVSEGWVPFVICQEAIAGAGKRAVVRAPEQARARGHQGRGLW